MTTHAQLPPHALWPTPKWRQQVIRLGRYLGLITEETPACPPTRRQQLIAAQDQRRAEQRRAAEWNRSHR